MDDFATQNVTVSMIMPYSLCINVVIGAIDACILFVYMLNVGSLLDSAVMQLHGSLLAVVYIM